ncbi:hypothetical protein [Pseudofrankia sp. BMG5.36]|uniref:hypothetical protein n=1 Tax=Pseudofrankia sp. BMG5.36 TaxID=1834512 RepID=UPI0008DA35C3|nr:hypothetical protein [Pseudofrankia sp. BMG5.36]OHV48906.1 hypothetical protein BCD48_13705 [Pseudofrankia sp. BMG5.36]
MTTRPVIDAGPALGFLAINKERLLISVLGRLSAPETVAAEVLRKSRSDGRFRAAEAVWQKLTPNWIEILPDDVTPELSAVVARITRLPMRQRMKESKDLGETMVIAHAVVAAEAGATVTVLIDDGAGAAMATSERRRLERLRLQGRPVGGLRLVSTLTVLERAAGGKHIPDRATMRTIYTRLRDHDDGLPPIERTGLLLPELWVARTRAR